MLEELVIKVVENAPAVAVLMWVAYRQQKLNEKMQEALLHLRNGRKEDCK